MGRTSVYVVVPKAGDTVTVRVASGTVQVDDTLHAVVSQTGGEMLRAASNTLQAEQAKLQREFNQMEAERDRERERATDAAISADAYVVRRMMRGWVIPMQYGDIFGATSLEAAALARRDESSAVEERLRRMVAAAPHASRPVQEAIREAYVLYYKAKGPGPKPPDSLVELHAKPPRVVQAQEDEFFDDVRACIARLTDAIDPELRDK